MVSANRHRQRPDHGESRALASEPALARRGALAIGLLGALLVSVSACGLTVTNEKPSFDELDPIEQAVVETVLKELTAFNSQVKKRTVYSIDEIVDRERINVAFEGKIFTYNLGNDIIHVSTWENLTPTQHKLVAGWFQLSSAQAEATYKKFFYRFMAVGQGVKQFMFKVLTPAWVFSHRTLFNIERDSIRASLSHYQAVGQGADMWSFVSRTCAPVLKQYNKVWGHVFKDIPGAKDYLRENFASLADPSDPTGYMYFICQWVEMGRLDATDLTTELNWLRDLPLP